jgi:ribosomal protein S18 acetylase RimI-like enzyme
MEKQDTSQINVRRAEPSDVLVIVEFNQMMAEETEGKRLSPEILTNGVSAVFADTNRGFYLVAENRMKEVVGCLMITFEWSDWRNNWFWWIQSVYVRADFRGKGVYRQLYDRVKTEAGSHKNVCGFRLYVEKENSVAQRVYENRGMTETHYLMYEEMIGDDN